MNVNTRIMFRYLALYLILALLVFLVGLNETIRNESFTIAEENIANQTTLNESWDDYQAFKASYVFTNEPFILLANFFGGVGILYMLFFSWRLGRDSEPLELNMIFSSFNVLLIFLIYLSTIIFNYLKGIFVDQLIIILYENIYTSIYVFRLLNEWFIFFLLVSYVLCWIANELKYLNFLKR